MRGKTSRSFVVVLAVVLLAAACGRSDSSGGKGETTTTGASSAACKGTLEASDVGVTPTELTIQVMADVGSPLAPGLFQGNVDAVNAFAKYWNAHGGIGCRQVKVVTWDSKLSAEESKNGLINGCKNAFAMVGDNALFNPDVSPMVSCADKAGAATGLPDIAALAADSHEQCAPTSFIIQGIGERCPIHDTGEGNFIGGVSFSKWLISTIGKTEKLHGLFLVPGDLPSTVKGAGPIVVAQERAGMVWDDTIKVSGRDTQAAYTARVQSVKEHNSNYVYDGSNDRAMINMRKEAKAQGVTSVKAWGCSLACYTKAFVENGGPDVDGTYAAMPFLPFEEAAQNAELGRFMDSLGSKADSFGAQAWQAGVAFKQAVDEIVQSKGPNAITRANLLRQLNATTTFDANGWMGKKGFRDASPCFLVVQLKAGKWVRVYPAKPGTFDCSPDNNVELKIDAAVASARFK